MLKDISFKDYLLHKEISSHDLSNIEKSVEHYLHAKSNPEEPNKAMVIGAIFHNMVLTPYIKSYVVENKDANRRTKKYKEWKDKQIYPILSVEEFQMLDSMKTAISNHPLANTMINNNSLGGVEKSIFFKHSDVKCKSRLDYINVDDKIIVDLKSISSADDKNIEMFIQRYKVYRQMAMYRLAAFKEFKEVFDTYLLFVEKSEPYGVRIIQLDDEYLDHGLLEINVILSKYKKDINSSWRGYPAEIITIEKPPWLK